jgi:hypothetical protein
MIGGVWGAGLAYERDRRRTENICGRDDRTVRDQRKCGGHQHRLVSIQAVTRIVGLTRLRTDRYGVRSIGVTVREELRLFANCRFVVRVRSFRSFQLDIRPSMSGSSVRESQYRVYSDQNSWV